MYINHFLYTDDIKKIAMLDLPWDQLQNSSILITGATGMIGTALVDVLMERNHSYGNNIHIYALGRSRKRAYERFREYMEQPCFSFVEKDINQTDLFEENVDYLFHCASNTHPRTYAEDPIGTIMTNVLGTDHVLQIALHSKARRVLFLSSVEIYGENRGDVETFDESYCGYLNCNTLRAGYPEGKRTGEALCQAYIERFGLDIVIPRICRVFGPTMLKNDSKALAQFIRKSVNNEHIVLKSDGNQYYSYCYVTDVVSALLYILFFGKSGEAYNISDENSDIRLKDLAHILAKFSGTNVIFELPDTMEAKGYSTATIARLNSTKLRKLGWKTENELAQQLSKTVEILKSEK